MDRRAAARRGDLPEEQPMKGSREIPIGRGVVLTSMTPEARDLLDHIMHEWKDFETGLRENSPDKEPTIYQFAYWLCRYSGLIKPL